MTRWAITQRVRALGSIRGVSFSATFNPSLLPSFDSSVLVALSRSQRKIWQDDAKTTLATAASDPVRRIACPFTGIEYSTASDAARPTLGNSGSKWWLAFDGIDDQLTSARSSSQPFTLFASGQVPTSGQSFSLFDGGATNQAYGAKTSITQTSAFDINNGTGFASSNTVNTANTVVLGAVFNGASSVINLNGTETAGSTSATALTGVTVGCRSGLPNLNATKIYGFVLCKTALSAADRAALSAYLTALGQ